MNGEEIGTCKFIKSRMTYFPLHQQWRTQGGTPPPTEIGKIVVEIWCYLPEVYTFGQESEIREICSKNCEKSQFSI